MTRSYVGVATVSVCMLCGLSGCQYFTYYKTNTTYAPTQQQTSAESVCTAMGAVRGNAALDWCVAQEEADRARYQSRLH